MRTAALLSSMLLALLLAACAAPMSDTAPAPEATPVPQVSGIARVGADSPDFSCKVAGDCAVKNVGNCCGYFPACVNKDSPVDPDAIRAECARTGTSSVCGWQDIQACDCVQDRCQPATGPLETDR